jgi:hypothetical protein
LVKYSWIFLVLVGALTLQAQETAEDKLGSWHLLSITPRISNTLSLQASVQSRYYEQLRNFNQFIVRTGIIYDFNPRISATFGYGYIVTDTTFAVKPKEGYKNEHQFGEQITLKDKIGRVETEHRFWLEQRLVHVGDGFDMRHRARYRLQINLPLNTLLYLNFHEEVFFNLRGKAFAQNRLYGALGVRMASHVSLQAGYFRTYANHDHLDRLRIAVFYNPDWRKKNSAGTP